MYVKASSPNNLSVGPFELETPLENINASSVFFWYNMHGQSMGSLALQIYSNTSEWVEQWSRSGDQGKGWQMAAIDVSSLILSNNFEVNGGGFAGCISVSDAEIWISNLIISSGNGAEYGGGIFINGFSQVTLLSCTISQNERGPQVELYTPMASLQRTECSSASCYKTVPCPGIQEISVVQSFLTSR
jgi:hypothetical protein